MDELSKRAALVEVLGEERVCTLTDEKISGYANILAIITRLYGDLDNEMMSSSLTTKETLDRVVKTYVQTLFDRLENDGFEFQDTPAAPSAGSAELS